MEACIITDSHMILLLRMGVAVAVLLRGGVLNLLAGGVIVRREALRSTMASRSGTVGEREVGTGRPNLESAALSIFG